MSGKTAALPMLEVCLTGCRLIIYFPVSALVTLFANILQNPQDARARSDVRLMNQVVSFLSILSTDDENNGVKRMLGVCSEFERIAKVVLDKAEKESHSRRKRKTNKEPEEPKPQAQPQLQSRVPEKRPAPRSPLSNSTSPPKIVFTPGFTGESNSNPTNSNNHQPFDPSVNSFSPALSNGSIPTMSEFVPGPTDYSDMMTGSTGLTPNFSDTTQQYPTGNVGSPLGMNMGSFQQPFVPQDLWQMPMTLEWDWADMTGMSYPPFDVGTGVPSPPPGPHEQHPNGQL